MSERLQNWAILTVVWIFFVLPMLAALGFLIYMFIDIYILGGGFLCLPRAC